MRAFLTKRLKKILSFGLVCCISFSITACGGDRGDNSSTVFSGATESSGFSSSSVKEEIDGLRVTTFDREVSLMDESVSAWLNGDADTLISEVVSANVSDRGKPVTLGYDPESLGGKTVKSAYVKVAKSGEDLSAAEKVKISKNKSAVEIYNLCPETEYVFSVTVEYADDGEETKEGRFKTADGVRFIYAQNTINVREIGGWQTEDGKRVKRGMIFRGGELDGKHESSFKLNAKGKKVLLNNLGIRFDMDLRASAGDTTTYNENGLGESVPRTYYDLVYYQSATTTEKGLEKLKRIFQDLAKPETYPVYIHCTYGTDRTGTICALLEALLGMSKADIIREYELTYLYFPHVNRNYGNSNGETFLKLLETIEATEGATLAEKTQNILLKAGVTQAEIDNIRNMLTE